MAKIEITDEASLEAWLKTRPRKDAEIIAFRAAARVFPLWGRAMEEEWAVNGSLSAIHFLRPLLMSGSGFIGPLGNLDFGSDKLTRDSSKNKSAFWALISSYSSVDSKLFNQFFVLEGRVVNSRFWVGGRLLQEIALQACMGANEALHSVQISLDGTWLMDGSFDYSGALTQQTRSTWISQFYQQIELDCQYLAARKIESQLSSAGLSLWQGETAQWFLLPNKRTRAIWAKDPPTWAFWEKWWDGVISGDMPFSPDLLRDVALIDDDIWQAGPKAVAERINLLIQRHALQREAAAINARLMEFIALNEGLGANLHNQPPDEELSPVKLRATLREISQALKDIEVALDGPEISPEVVVGLGQRLKDLWDGLTTKMKFAIGGLAIVCVTGFSQFSSGFMGAAGEDFYQLAKRNIDIPSFSRRLLDFGKQLEKQPKPAPVFPQRTPVDL